MCRTVHALLTSAICFIQMVVRVFMTTMLMLENILRMILQTLYNMISFFLQLISLIPVCCVFLITSRMKCFMCGGGGPCPVNRGGACDCLMSLIAIIILFFIFRATGVLEKIFFSIGYAKATTRIVRFVPTTGSVTECSRNDTDTEYIMYPIETTPTQWTPQTEETSSADPFGRIFREGPDPDVIDVNPDDVTFKDDGSTQLIPTDAVLRQNAPALDVFPPDSSESDAETETDAGKEQPQGTDGTLSEGQVQDMIDLEPPAPDPEPKPNLDDTRRMITVKDTDMTDGDKVPWRTDMFYVEAK